MRNLLKLLVWLCCGSSWVALGQSPYVCTVEPAGSGTDGEDHCVFRGVFYNRTSGNVQFAAPEESSKPITHVSFEQCDMQHIPPGFVTEFGSGLKVLSVENCRLRSVVVTEKLEKLYARGNKIDKVILQQEGPSSVLFELDLSGSYLTDVRNLTKLKNLKTLRLNSNEKLPRDNTFDFSSLAGLNKLEELYLSNMRINYLSNSRKTRFPSAKLLDLSQNNLLNSDLRFEIFEDFESLHTIKFNDNNMEEIDYGTFPGLNLKTVYLNGNAFPCQKINTMLQFLHDNNIETPTERGNPCGTRREEQGFCCSGSVTSWPKPAPPKEDDTSGRTTTTSERPPIIGPVPVTPQERDPRPEQPPTGDGQDADGSSDSIGWIIGVGVVVAILAAGGIGFGIYKSKSKPPRGARPCHHDEL